MKRFICRSRTGALFTPLAHTLADASGLPLMTVLMVQVIDYATPELPYQASPIVVAMGMGGVPRAIASGSASRSCSSLSFCLCLSITSGSYC